jgi:16S rRNA (guanine527-N7)-methyltransferase
VMGCHQLGIQLTKEQVSSFRIYRHHLKFWNPSTGLISPQDEQKVDSRHFLDSLSLLNVLDLRQGTRVLDVGSGGGFPGLPLKVCRPGIFLTLLEPKEKRFYFLKNMVTALGLERVSLYCQTAQEARRDPSLSGRFDLVLARAVAAMNKLIVLCFPFVRAGGVFVAYKGRKVKEELSRASAQIEQASGELQDVVRVYVPGVPAPRYLVLMKKLAEQKGLR